MMHVATFLKDICLHRKTGHLSFFRGDIQKHLYFQDGNLIFLKTDVPGERLGEILHGLGKISRQTLEEIPLLMQPDSMIGETLVQKKLVSRQDLYESLVHQMTAAALSLFPIFDGEIAFRERERFFEGGVEQKMNLVQLIARGIRDMGDPPDIGRFLAGKIPVRARPENLHLLTEAERAAYDRIDGEKDVETLARSFEGGPKAFRKDVFLLFGLDLVELRNVPRAVCEDEARPFAPRDRGARFDEVAALHAKLGGLDDCQILGVPSGADEAEIKKAYFRLARKFHPDLFGRDLPPDDKERIEAVFDGITKAYRNLLARSGKPAPAAKPAGRPAPDQGRTKDADIQFRQAKTLFSTGRYEEAIGLLEDAVRIKNDKADYHLLLAMAQARIPALRKKAEGSFLHAIALEPWNPEAYIGLGLLYKNEGMLTRARKQFEKAVETDPDHAVARRELKEIRAKPEGQKGLKGILSKDLFGSKKK